MTSFERDICQGFPSVCYLKFNCFKYEMSSFLLTCAEFYTIYEYVFHQKLLHAKIL